MKKGVVILLAATFLSSCFSDLKIPGDPFNDEFPGGGNGSIGGGSGNGNGNGGFPGGNGDLGGGTGGSGSGGSGSGGSGSGGGNGDSGSGGSNNDEYFNHEKRPINANTYGLGGITTNEYQYMDISTPKGYKLNTPGSFYKIESESIIKIYASPKNAKEVFKNDYYYVYDDGSISLAGVPVVYTIISDNENEKITFKESNYDNIIFDLSTTSKCEKKDDGKCIKRLYIAQLYLLDEWINYGGPKGFPYFNINLNFYMISNDNNNPHFIYYKEKRAPKNSYLEKRLPDVFKNYSQYYKTPNDEYTNQVIKDVYKCKYLDKKCSFLELYTWPEDHDLQNEYENFAGFVYTSKFSRESYGHQDDHEYVSKNLYVYEIEYEVPITKDEKAKNVELKFETLNDNAEEIQVNININ